MRSWISAVLITCFIIDHGDGLYLSPLINNGSIEKARELSSVDSEVLGFNITSYSGFITVDEKYDSNLWFWYFPAEKLKTEDAPFIVWLQGGPGFSTLKGLFEELGPFSANNNGTELIENPYSWHIDHNLLFIDNPVGTGFSFTNHSDGYATNQTQISEQLYKFLTQFLKLFPELKTVPMYLCGQSYGAKHVSSLAYEIHKNNPTAEFKMNLKGLTIGNGFIDALKISEGYAEYLYQLGFLDDHGKKEMENLQNIFKKSMADGDYKLAAYKYSDILFELITNYEFFNVYDYTDEGNVKWWTGPYTDFIKRDDIRKALHTGESKFHYLDFDVRLKLTVDFIMSGTHWLEHALEHYKTLLYNGQMDVLCAYPLSVNVHKSLKWSGSEEYKKAVRSPWYMGRKLLGFSKKAGNMLEVMVRNAGHNVPGDQPEKSLLLIKSFINDIPLNETPQKV